MDHLYLISGDERERALAWAELRALAGVEGCGRVAIGAARADVSRAAYVAACAELLGRGRDPAALAEVLSGGEHEFERFRITLVTVPPRPQVDSREALVEVARPLRGSVDLTSPQTELLLIGAEGEWLLGRVVGRSAMSFRRHEHKPYGFSSSLPARLARCMVNLGAAPGDAIIDPCCGVGTIPLEAWAAGVRAVGAEVNGKLAGMTRANLEHFGYPTWVCVADGASLAARGDAVVTDLPYGRQSRRQEGLYERLLANFPSLAPRLVVVTATPIEPLLAAAGYEVRQRVDTRRGGFERRVYVAEVKAGGPQHEAR